MFDHLIMAVKQMLNRLINDGAIFASLFGATAAYADFPDRTVENIFP